MSRGPLYVTRPTLPSLEDFEPYLRVIWASGQVTNGGAFHARLEAALAEYLDVPYVALLANGTLALLVALRALGLRGEVITTPFSFVATTHALLWNDNPPVFADIDPTSLNLDPDAVERAITPDTEAILAVHVYGRPCALQALRDVADRHGLRLIYDAAHAFGVRLQDDSLWRNGDLSVLSFHGTKVFHTFEGGAIVCHDAAMKQRIDLLKNFGFRSETEVVELGINAKMNEFQAAFGLYALSGVDAEIAARARIATRYGETIEALPGLSRLPDMPGVARPNHAYFPIQVGPSFPLDRDGLYSHLKRYDIHARRYFHPLISAFPMYAGARGLGHLPVAESVAARILCLPIHGGMDYADCQRVIDALRAAV